MITCIRQSVEDTWIFNLPCLRQDVAESVHRCDGGYGTRKQLFADDCA